MDEGERRQRSHHSRSALSLTRRRTASPPLPRRGEGLIRALSPKSDRALQDVPVINVEPRLDDRGATCREAIDLAIADAREEAARYAASLGIRIVRTVRVTDGGQSFEEFMTAELMRRLRGETDETTVSVRARLVMDLVVAEQ